MFGLGAQEVIILVVLCALAAFALWAWAAKRPDVRAPAAPDEERPERIRPTAAGRWLSPRRVGFTVLAWLALGLAAKNAATEPEDARIAVFIGGALWSVVFLAIAFWPRRRPPAEREPRAGGARPWERGPSETGPRE